MYTRKFKPVEAIQVTKENRDELVHKFYDSSIQMLRMENVDGIFIPSTSGYLPANFGDWIVEGEVLSDEDFHAIYEKAQRVAAAPKKNKREERQERREI